MTNQNKAIAHPLNRRTVLSSGLGLGGSLLTVTISARALGLSPAIAKVPEKIVIGQVPFNTQVTIYGEAIGQFKEEGLSIEYHKAIGGPAVIQALGRAASPLANPESGPL